LHRAPDRAAGDEVEPVPAWYPYGVKAPWLDSGEGAPVATLAVPRGKVNAIGGEVV
jgi:hypothetical protein